MCQLYWLSQGHLFFDCQNRVDTNLSRWLARINGTLAIVESRLAESALLLHFWDSKAALRTAFLNTLLYRGLKRQCLVTSHGRKWPRFQIKIVLTRFQVHLTCQNLAINVCLIVVVYTTYVCELGCWFRNSSITHALVQLRYVLIKNWACSFNGNIWIVGWSRLVSGVLWLLWPTLIFKWAGRAHMSRAKSMERPLS